MGGLAYEAQRGRNGCVAGGMRQWVMAIRIRTGCCTWGGVMLQQSLSILRSSCLAVILAVSLVLSGWQRQAKPAEPEPTERVYERCMVYEAPADRVVHDSAPEVRVNHVPEVLVALAERVVRP